MHIFRNNFSLTLLTCLMMIVGLQSFAQTDDTWIQKNDFGGGVRSGAASFSINGKGYMGTGFTGSGGTRFKDFWEYDPSTNVWTQKANLGDTLGKPSPTGMNRYYASGFSIGDKGYIVCGNNGINAADGGTTNDVWEYNPGNNTWTEKTPFPGMARMAAVGFSIGLKGYFGTGEQILYPSGVQTVIRVNDFWEFDPNAGPVGKGIWIEKAKINNDVNLVRAFAVGFSIGNMGYIGTGHHASVGSVYNDFWEFDPSADNGMGAWTQKANLTNNGRWQAVGLSIGAYGYVGLGSSADFWEYNPATNIWIQKANLGVINRALAAGFSIGNKAYIGTGSINSGHSSDFWEFTPSANWSGATSNDWNLPSNWHGGFVPDDNTNTIIPNTINNPFISSTAVCNNLTIDATANLTIATSKSLTVNGTLTNNAGILGLVIKSDNTGSGSLIHNTSDVNATIERYVHGDWASSNSGWHFISSPVAGQAISDFTTSGANNGYNFYGWSEPENLWINYTGGAFNVWNGGTNYNTGQGYMISYEANQTKTFTGNINVSSVTKTDLTKTNGGTNYSWHLLGNPFSSALKWNDGNWVLSNVAGIAKIWNEAEKGYSDIDAYGIISSTQGFMISVNDANNSLIIPAISRIHNNSSFKSAQELRYLLLASEQDGNSAQESQIHINPSATTGFDFNIDSRFLQGYAPQFYSLSGNEMLSTNSLPSISSSDIIPFGFIKNQADNFKIELKETINGQSVYLTDRKADSTQNLTENPVYNFSSAEGDDPARFILHFQNVIASVQENKSLETFNIYQQNGIVSISTLQPIDAEVLLSNILGQVVLRGKTDGNTHTKLNTAKLQSGVYIVSISSNGKVESKKMILSKK